MALGPCRECEREVSSEAESCPHCGVPKPVRPERIKPKTLVIIFGIAAFLLILGLLSDPPPAPREQTAEEIAQAEARAAENELRAAIRACQDLARRRLRAPGSADFAPVYSSAAEVDSVSGNYRVGTWVDAENAMGGKLRNDIYCELTRVDEDTWRQIDLRIVGR